MQQDINSLKQEIDLLKKENERLKSKIIALEDSRIATENTNISFAKERVTEGAAIEWEKIAQTLSHTMKGPNNNIVNKLVDLKGRIDKPTDEIVSLMSIIEAEAKYSNDIIGLFDIIRKGNAFTAEIIKLSEIFQVIKNSEKRCISLAWNNASQLSKETLDRLKGQFISNESRQEEHHFLNFRYSENINYEKTYVVHKTALNTIVDEFILNMFRYAMSSHKPIPYEPCKDKPEYFEIEFLERKNKLAQSVIDIIFRNSSREPISKAYKNIFSDEKTISLSKKSFGLYLAHLFSGQNKNFESIKFYNMEVPDNTNLSEIILTLRASD